MALGGDFPESAGCFLVGPGTLTSHPGTGESLLEDCAREQLHLSGRIQAHGALVAVDLHDRLITHVSANIGELIGAQPEALFDTPLTGIFAADEHQRLSREIDRACSEPESHDLYGMRLATPSAGSVDVILHRVGGQIVVEMEGAQEDDRANLNLVLSTSRRLGSAHGVSEIEAAIATTVRALTGFDRVMVYWFHDDGHGEVVAEDRRPELRPYLGHHFPASDIPSQARAIYARKASRYIPDVDEGDVAVIASPRMAGASIDLSLASLRSVSPYHLEYMRNMETAASVSFAMSDGFRLTRLVSCTSEKPRRLSTAKIRSCELVVLQANLQIAAAERLVSFEEAFNRESIRAELRESMREAPSVADGLLSTSPQFLDLCDADGAAIRVSGQYRSMGAVPPENGVLELAGEIRSARSPAEPWTTDRLPPSPAGPLGAAGVLFLPLSDPEDFLVWFRKEIPQRLKWLGDPHAHTGSINPRKSFDTWLDEVHGVSAPWTDSDLLSAQLMAYEVDAARLGHAQAYLAHLGLHDALTGLPNRRYWSRQLATRLAGATRAKPVAVLFIDLNHFKRVNDEYGHDVGDRVLQEAANRSSEVTRASRDLVGRPHADESPTGRLGGDEFVVLLSGVGAEGAFGVADRIRASLLKPIMIRPGLHLTVGAAVGVAVASRPEDPESLLQRADAAMYADKR